MGLFDDIVPPDTASGGGYRPLRITGLFDDIVAPSDAAAPGAETPASFGDDDKIVDVAPAQKPRKNEVVSFGADDEVVQSPTPRGVNGTPERLVPLAPQATGPIAAPTEGDIPQSEPMTGTQISGTSPPGASPTPRARVADDLMGGMTIDPLTGVPILVPRPSPKPPVASTPDANGMFPAQPLDDIPLSKRHGYLGGGAFGDAGALAYEEAQAEKADRIAAAEANSRRATAFRERQERRIAYPWETPSEDQRQIDALIAQGMPLEYAEQAVKRPGGDRVKAAIGAEKYAEEAAAGARTAPLASRNYARNLAEEFVKSVADVSVATTAGAVRAGAYLGGTQNKAHQLADWIGSGREGLKEAFPGEVSRQGDLALEMAGGLGSSVPFMATGVAAAMLGLPAGAATALIASTGAFSQGEMSRAEAAEFLKKRDAELRQFYRLDDPELKGAARRTAQEAFDRARDVSADDLKLLTVYLVNGAMGATEALPIANALERINHRSGGAISRVAKAMGYNSLEEAVQEGAQQFVQNATEQLVYNKDRLVGDGVERAMIIAGLAGVLQGGMIQAGGEAHGKLKSRNADALIPRPPEPAPIDLSDIQPGKASTSAVDSAPAPPNTSTPPENGPPAIAPPGRTSAEQSAPEAKTLSPAQDGIASAADVAAGPPDGRYEGASPASEVATAQDHRSPDTEQRSDAAATFDGNDPIVGSRDARVPLETSNDFEYAAKAAAADNTPGFTPSQTGKLLRGEDEQIVDKWREVRKPLPVNAPAQRKDLIRGYRRELSKLGLLNAKTEAEVRDRLVGRQGESLEAAKPDIIERIGAAPPGAPPPSTPRIADLIEPRPAGGVFDSKGSATMPGEVRSLGGARRMRTRARDKAGGVEPASSNDTHGAPSGAVSASGKPSGRPTEKGRASAAAEREWGNQRLTFGHDGEIVAPANAGQQIAAREQGAVPGAGKARDADLARRRADRPLNPSRKQKPPDGERFGDGDESPDRLDATKKAPEPRPEGGVFDSGSARADPLRPPSPQHTRAIPRAASEPVATFRNVWLPKLHPDYAAANAGNARAALRLVRDLVNGENIAAAREKFGTDVTYAPVSAAEARGTDAVPGALASYYTDKAGGRRETDIRRINRAYQTGASAMARLAHRAIFRGPVTPGARYVLVDNVSALGSTLADLADHIQRGGGEVAGIVVFVNEGRASTLTPTKASVHDIKRRFGHAIQDLFGIAPEGLTAGEAGYLRDFQDAQSLRDRAAASQVKAAARRRAREVREENDRLNLIDPLGNSVAAPSRIASEIYAATNDVAAKPGLFLQRAGPHTIGLETGAPAPGIGSAGSGAAEKAASRGIVYLRTDVTGKLAPYVGQAINNKRYMVRQFTHAKAFPKSKFRFDIVDRADPGVQLDIAEHNFIQALTGGVRARRSDSVSNGKDPIGPRRRRALGLPKAR